MAFAKGQSGNPGGRSREKPWREALMRAVKRRFPAEDGKEDPQALDKVADAVVLAAIGGDIQAAKEIGDRLDGKAVQGVELGGPDGGPIVTSLAVEFVKPDAGQD